MNKPRKFRVDLLKIRVQPRASIEKIVKIDKQNYRVYTHKPAVYGEANKRLIELLSDYFGIKKNKVLIKKGLKSKDKTIEIKI